MNMVTSCTFVMSWPKFNSCEKKLNIYIKNYQPIIKRSFEIMRISSFSAKTEPFAFFNWPKSNKFFIRKTF